MKIMMSKPKKKQKTVEYIVECGIGHTPYPSYSTLDEAMIRRDMERLIPSYLRPGSFRKAEVLKKTTTYERMP